MARRVARFFMIGYDTTAATRRRGRVLNALDMAYCNREGILRGRVPNVRLIRKHSHQRNVVGLTQIATRQHNNRFASLHPRKRTEQQKSPFRTPLHVNVSVGVDGVGVAVGTAGVGVGVGTAGVGVEVGAACRSTFQRCRASGRAAGGCTCKFRAASGFFPVESM